MNCNFLNEKTGMCRGKEDLFCVHRKGETVDKDYKTVVRTEDFSEKVYFAPWVGKDYEKANFFGKRVLVLGNSHYCPSDNRCKEWDKCEKCPKQLTVDCCYNTINNAISLIDYVSGNNSYLKTLWTSLEVVSGLDYEALEKNDCYEALKVRDSIAYYNFVQESLSDGQKKPTSEQCRNSEDAFFEVFEKLRPQLVIALGVSHMWTDLPSSKYDYVDPIKVDGYPINHGYYLLNDGAKVHTIWIYHPSYHGEYDHVYWNNVIKKAIETESNK